MYITEESLTVKQEIVDEDTFDDFNLPMDDVDDNDDDDKGTYPNFLLLIYCGRNGWHWHESWLIGAKDPLQLFLVSILESV